MGAPNSGRHGGSGKDKNPLSDITAQVSNVQKHLDFTGLPLSDEKSRREKLNEKQLLNSTVSWHKLSNNTRVVHTNFLSTQLRNSPPSNNNFSNTKKI